MGLLLCGSCLHIACKPDRLRADSRTLGAQPDCAVLSCGCCSYWAGELGLAGMLERRWRCAPQVFAGTAVGADAEIGTMADAAHQLNSVQLYRLLGGVSEFERASCPLQQAAELRSRLLQPSDQQC